MGKRWQLVYCHTRMNWMEGSLSSWLLSVFEAIPQPYIKNMKSFCVVHPTMAMRMTLWMLRPWLHDRIWDRVRYVDSIDTLVDDFRPGSANAARRQALRRGFP